MLSPEENELLCRTGPGTPMGDLFRRFWLPVALRRRLLNAVRDLQRGQEPGEPRRGYTYRVHPSAELEHRSVSFEEVARAAMLATVAEQI